MKIQSQRDNITTGTAVVPTPYDKAWDGPEQQTMNNPRHILKLSCGLTCEITLDEATGAFNLLDALTLEPLQEEGM